MAKGKKADKAEKAGKPLKVESNFENEFKIGLVATGEQEGNEPEIADAIWGAYLQKRFEESESDVPLPSIRRANGKLVKTPYSQEVKGLRVREFSIAADGKHPCNVEIRQETGKKPKTMIKIGNGAGPHRPALSREEFAIRDFPMPFDMKKLPEGVRETLTEAFNRARVEEVVPALQTESFRRKAIVHAVVNDPKLGTLECDIELAEDIGVGTTMAGQKWDINEFEGEVKSIRLKGQKADIKEAPESVGVTKDYIRGITDRILDGEQKAFIAFANGYLAGNGLERDVDVMPIYHSKSKPGVLLLQPVLQSGGEVVKKAVAAVREQGFHVVPELEVVARRAITTLPAATNDVGRPGGLEAA